MQTLIPGPTYQEMLDPRTLPAAFQQRATAARKDELDPANLFNITWRGLDGQIRCETLPKKLTGVQANIGDAARTLAPAKVRRLTPAPISNRPA